MKFQKPTQLLKRIASAALKTVGILLSLYIFVISLTFLSTSFRILGGRNLSSFFSSSELAPILQNSILAESFSDNVSILKFFKNYRKKTNNIHLSKILYFKVL
jgi:hypothetical protein